MAAPPLVLCIPGPWEDHATLERRVALDSHGFLCGHGVLVGIGSAFSCGLSHEVPDCDLAEAFASAGGHWADTPEMAAIGAHRSVVYLEGVGGSRDAAEAMMRAAAGIVRAGGLGVKVEGLGLAHPPARWLELVDGMALGCAHDALVDCVGDEFEVASCGMHHFGWRDASVAGLHPDAGAQLLRAFNLHVLLQAPDIGVGETFAAGPDAPPYRIEDDRTQRHDADSPLCNPCGTWRLVGPGNASLRDPAG